MAASASFAQQLAPAKECGSVVIVKCDAPAPANNRSTADRVRESRNAERRRQDPLTHHLEGVVIEGEATRRRNVEETMSGAFPELRPREGNYTYATGEGSKCTCMNVCPPWPFPCCTCSRQMGRYSTMPGSSPLN